MSGEEHEGDEELGREKEKRIKDGEGRTESGRRRGSEEDIVERI